MGFSVILRGFRIPMRGYEFKESDGLYEIKKVPNPHEGS